MVKLDKKTKKTKKTSEEVIAEVKAVVAEPAKKKKSKKVVAAPEPVVVAAPVKVGIVKGMVFGINPVSFQVFFGRISFFNSIFASLLMLKRVEISGTFLRKLLFGLAAPKSIRLSS